MFVFQNTVLQKGKPQKEEYISKTHLIWTCLILKKHTVQY